LAPLSTRQDENRGSFGQMRFQTSRWIGTGRRRIRYSSAGPLRVQRSPSAIRRSSPGIPQMRLMKFFERSSGYLKTTTSKRSGSRKWYENLSTMIRSLMPASSLPISVGCIDPVGIW